MKIKKGEKVVVITDMKTIAVGNALENAAGKITKNVAKFVLEDFGRRPLKKIPDKIKKSVSGSDVSFFCAQQCSDGKVNELITLRRVVQKIVTEKGGRHAGMPGVTVEMMQTGMNADYEKIKKLCRKVYSIVRKAKTITVKNEKGTMLKAEFTGKRLWVICDGDIKAGHWSNLPDGEVFTAPLNVEGTAVVDLLGDVFVKEGTLKKPMKFEIKNSRVVKITHPDKKLIERVKKYISQDKNASRVGEFAIGTNIFLKKFVGSMLQDEKFPGVHIAFGYPYPSMTNAKWTSNAHMDAVMTKTTIIADGKKIMNKGKFTI
jgi:leucyl aminopeptidase (aminopeptidase T)